MTRIVPENVKRERLQAHVIEAIQFAQTVRGTQFIQIIAPCSLEGAGWIK
jgi:pyruvate/2-oxoacid:ferredoxin oxidoreductase beta subunit